MSPARLGATYIFSGPAKTGASGHLEPEANQEELEKFIAKVAPRFSSRNAAGVFA